MLHSVSCNSTNVMPVSRLITLYRSFPMEPPLWRAIFYVLTLIQRNFLFGILSCQGEDYNELLRIPEAFCYALCVVMVLAGHASVTAFPFCSILMINRFYYDMSVIIAYNIRLILVRKMFIKQGTFPEISRFLGMWIPLIKNNDCFKV